MYQNCPCTVPLMIRNGSCDQVIELPTNPEVFPVAIIYAVAKMETMTYGSKTLVIFFR